MKLYYFSGTGNSLAIARRIAQGIPGTQLLPILRASPSERPTGALGIVFPVHMVSVPVPVRSYLNSADLSGLQYFFAVGTHGGTAGTVGAYINNLQRARGGRLLDEYFAVRMVLNTPKGGGSATIDAHGLGQSHWALRHRSDVCPSGRVVLQPGTPHWDAATPCYYCYACFNFCPEQAIGVKHYTLKTGRYHHAGIHPADIAAQKPSTSRAS